ncbi:MAG: cadherin-like domain-containing protein, partial [Saprospiraceae bacterium]|nr:cadherin-like domain-containing protein [Saprospiraceae bacterium]
MSLFFYFLLGSFFQINVENTPVPQAPAHQIQLAEADCIEMPAPRAGNVLMFGLPAETPAPSPAPFWMPAAPSITATKTFMQVGTDTGPTGPSPGDVLEYTVVITNAAGAMDATGTKFTDTVDPNTTLVSGSVKTSVVAVNDAYSTVGNVSISVPAASGLTVNDVNLDGDVLTVTGINTAGTQGNVMFNADGSFTFNPAPGFEGPTTFTYTVNDGTFNSTGTVTVTVTGMIWFIDDSAPPGGDGRLSAPWNSINTFNATSLDGTGDNIFVYSGTYNNTGNTPLLGQQKLIGQGAQGTLAALAGVTFSVFPPISPATIPSVGGTNPVINQADKTISMPSQNRVMGVDIVNTSGTALLSASSSTAFIRDVSVNNTGGIAVQLTNTALNAVFKSISASNGSHGIRIQNTTGSFEITGSGTMDGSGGTFSNIGQRGIELITVSNVTLRNLTMNNANTQDAGFDGICDEDQNTSCYAAIHMNAVTGTNLFNNVDITTTEEHGINGNNVTNLTMTNCTVTGAGSLDATDEAAAKFIDLTGTCSFTGCTFSNSGVRNMHIRTGTGSLNLTINNCNFSNTVYNIARFDCFEMRTLNAATATLNITNSSFHRAGSKGIQCVAEGSSTFNFNVSNSSIQRFGNPMAGIEAASVGTATINFNITNNTAIEAGLEPAVLASTFNTSTLHGRVNNNASIEFGHSSATIFANTRMLHEQNSVAKLEIKDNPNITSINAQEGIVGISRIGTNASSRLDFIVNNNNLTNGAGIPEGIETRTGTSSGGTETNTNCSFITSNDVVTAGSRAFRARIINGSAFLNLQGSGPDVTANWTGNGNTNAGGTVISFAQTPAVITFGGTCNTPTHAFALTEEELLAALAANETAPVVETAPEAVEEAAHTEAEPDDEPTTSAMMAFSGETVSVGGVPGFPLPAGQTMTIVFRVTIDDPFPLGVCTVSNQGTVMGSNFANVLTDDPGVAGTANPTVTMLNIAPTITVCQTNITTGTDPGLCTSSEAFSATAVGCPAPTLTFRIGATVITSPYVFPIGTTTVDVTASNGVSPDATCSFTVTVTDTQAPD